MKKFPFQVVLFVMAALFASSAPVLAEVTELEATGENYKDVLSGHDDYIVMFSHAGVPVFEGERFIEALDKQFGDRIEILRIEMASWPDDLVWKWMREDNEESLLPAFHVYIDGTRRLRSQHAPAVEDFDAVLERYDAVLRGHGL